MTKRGAVAAIVGADSYLAEVALERLLASALGPDRETSVQVVRGDESTWVRILDGAGMRSLFAEQRAVVVRGAEGLKGDGEGVEAYLDDPTPGVTLVLMAGKPDRRRTVWKRILEKATVLAADPLRGAKLRAYVSEELRRRKMKIAGDGIEELLERVGSNLRRLMGEVDKLEAFAEGRDVSAEDVAKVLGRGMARPLYVLGDAIAQRITAQALEELESALEEGERPELLLGAVHRSLRQVRGLRQLVEERASRDEMARRLGLPPNMAFKLPALIEASRRWREADLAVAVEALAGADAAVKVGAEPRTALAAAVAAACGGARRPVRLSPSPTRAR